MAAGGWYYYKNYYNSFEFVAGPLVSSAHSPAMENRYLADKNGRTLYMFTGDGDLKSNCTGDCLERWPVFEYDNIDPSQHGDALSKRINIIKRPDGYLQFAYGLKPLYYYVGDPQPGMTNGQGLDGGKWAVIPLLD